MSITLLFFFEELKFHPKDSLLLLSQSEDRSTWRRSVPPAPSARPHAPPLVLCEPKQRKKTENGEKQNKEKKNVLSHALHLFFDVARIAMQQLQLLLLMSPHHCQNLAAVLLLLIIAFCTTKLLLRTPEII